ncbi:MAG: hypothetical protein R3E12_04405 [Candidatus Eisenbacteria bacterium]
MPRAAAVIRAAIVLTPLLASSLRAEVLTWAIGADGNWNVATNWNPQDVPDEAGEEAVIPTDDGPYTVTLTTNLSLDAIRNDNAEATVVLNGRSLWLGTSEGFRNAGTFYANWGEVHGNVTNAGTGVLDIPTGMFLFLGNGIVFENDGVALINSDRGSADAALQFTGSGTIRGSGEIQLLTAGSFWDARIIGSTEVTQETGHTIRGEGGIEAMLVNEGIVSADAPDRWLRLFTYGKTNRGLMEATNGGILSIACSVSQNEIGVIRADGGIVQLEGNAYLVGGSLESTNGGWIEQVGSAAYLVDLTNRGEIGIRQGQFLVFRGTELVNDGTIAVNSDGGPQGSAIQVESDVRVTGGGEIVLHTTGAPNLALLSGQTLTTGPDQTIRGAGSIQVELVNEGRIVADDVDGHPLQLASGTKTNSGTIEASPGAVLEIRGTVYNDGLIVADPAGSVHHLGGWLINAATMRAEDGGEIECNTAEFRNLGTVEAVGAGIYRTPWLPQHYDPSSRTLTGGAWRALDGGSVRLLSMPIWVNAAEVEIRGASSGFYLDEATSSALAGLALNASAGTFAIDGGYGFVTGGAFENRGVVRIGDGSTLEITGDYRQTVPDPFVPGRMPLTSVTGTVLGADPIQIESGRLEGTGNVVADVVNAGTVAPGTSVGTLTIDGSYTQGESGCLEIELESNLAGGFDQLVVSGTANLGGTLYVPTIDETMVQDGDQITVLTCAARVGEFDDVIACPGPGLCVEPIYTEASVIVVVHELDPASAPEEAGSSQIVDFRASHTISGPVLFLLDLPDAAEVTVSLHDAGGRRVATIVDGQESAGHHEYPLPQGTRLSSGVFFARAGIRSPTQTTVRTATVAVVR